NCLPAVSPGSEPVRTYRRLRALRSEEHTSELQSPDHLVCRLLREKKNNKNTIELRGKNERRSYHLTCTVNGESMRLKYVVTRLDSDGSFDGSAISFFNDRPTTETYTLSLHDALPI